MEGCDVLPVCQLQLHTKASFGIAGAKQVFVATLMLTR